MKHWIKEVKLSSFEAKLLPSQREQIIPRTQVNSVWMHASVTIFFQILEREEHGVEENQPEEVVLVANGERRREQDQK